MVFFYYQHCCSKQEFMCFCMRIHWLDFHAHSLKKPESTRPFLAIFWPFTANTMAYILNLSKVLIFIIKT